MRLMNAAWMKELLARREGPCVSIYLPMRRASPPAAEENPRLFRELLERAEAEMGRTYPVRVVRAVAEKVRSAVDDTTFWTGDRDGVAVFASADLLRVIDLRLPVDAAALVADMFHVKPLIRELQSARQYHVLTFTQRRVQMYLGTGGSRLVPLDSSKLPQTPDVVSKMRMSKAISANADLRTSDTQYPGEGTAPAPVLLETFMRAVDRAVWENFSRDAGLPLVLCAAESNHAPFRAVSKNVHLLPEGIKLDPAGIDRERLGREAWAIMEPKVLAEVRELKDRFMAAKAHQRGADELGAVAEAVQVGRVGTLMVDGGRSIPGRIDPTTGAFSPGDEGDARVDDVLDDLAERVLRTDGDVLVLPTEMMPNDAALAAIYRY